MTLNSVIESLNLWSSHFIRFAWPMFWQSSLLIIAMFLLDLATRRKLRPAVRYVLWLVVLAKLLLPPSFAFPTGAGWWVRAREVAPARQPTTAYTVTYGPSRTIVPLPNPSHKVLPPPMVRLSSAAWALIATGGCALALLSVMLWRWRRLQRELRRSEATPTWLTELVSSAQREVRYRRPVRIRLTNALISPALWGLFRPVIVLPVALVERLGSDQLRAVLLHELFHLRNGDVWINCFQSLLQIVYWWHPLLWFANARIRRIREEAVDDAVRLALGQDAETYPPTLLEVARLALARPLATLGLVGILESRHALRQRVERLVNFPAPRRAGLTIVSVCVVFVFAGVALPMGQAPAKRGEMVLASNSKVRGASSERLTSAPANSTGWDIAPLTDQGSVEYDIRTGIASATNGAVLTSGDTTLSADSIELNRETGEVLAKGSVSLKALGIYLPMGGRLSGNVTNLQLAQLQVPGGHPSARPQSAISGRRAILYKLNAIRLNNVVFDNLPLSEVVNYLSNESKKRDPEGKGINFIFISNANGSAPATIDPATGAPIATSQADSVDITSVSIRLPSPLTDVRLVDVLDAIIKVADKRIRYSIEDYAVSFRLAGNETPVPLFSRKIMVDPGAFAQGLESVVGFSVGSFQTGGQGGGGGQQNGSGITVPRVQVAPNGGAGQGGQGGIQGGGGGISGVTRPTTMVTPQAVRQFFVNAGVDLTPPKSIFYNDRSGALMVHASMEDLDLIEKAVGSLSAGSIQPSSVRLNETSSGSGATTPEETKAPVLGDFPTVSKVLTKTVEVAPASSPLTPTASAADTSKEKLFTRIIRVDANNFFMGIQQRTALSPKATPEESIEGFRKLLLDAGVQLLAPKAMFYNPNTGTLLVRASEKDLDTIEQKIQVLSVPPPQVNIKVKFVEIPKGDILYFLALLRDLRIQSPASSTPSPVTTPSSELRGPLAEVMTDPQFRDLLTAVKQRDGTEFLNEASVVTLSGRQAQIQIADIKTIVVKINPQALVLPGVSSTNLFITENLRLGPVLDVVPVVADDGMTVSLDVSANVLGFIGYDEPAESEEVAVYIEGRRKAMKPPHPRMRARTLLHTVAAVPDGQTLMLGEPTDVMITYDKDGKAVSEPGVEKKDLLVFVTTTLIDPAGNPVRSSAVPGEK